MIYNAIFNDYIFFILIDLYNINLHVPRVPGIWNHDPSVGWTRTEVNTVMETAPFLDEQGIFQARCVDVPRGQCQSLEDLWLIYG